jgi:multiple sugar transport system ATP-binding protein
MNLVPAPLVGAGGANLIAGFRPEHMHVNGSASDAISFDARIDVIEYLGNDKLVHSSRDETKLTALIPVEQPVTEGESMTFAVSREKLHLFDAESEQAVH